jgi:hypothetical protein
MLLACGLLSLNASCGPSDVDRAAYVSRNLQLLAAFPTPPGSEGASTVSRRWTLEKHLFGGSYVAGYKTYRSFFTPKGTQASDLAAFYHGHLRGWRRANWGHSYSGEQSVCYRGSLASICVRWLTNVDPSQQSGVPFQVAVDSEAYAHPDTS